MFKKTVSAVSAILMLLSVAAFPTFAEGQQTVTKNGDNRTKRAAFKNSFYV